MSSSQLPDIRPVARGASPRPRRLPKKARGRTPTLLSLSLGVCGRESEDPQDSRASGLNRRAPQRWQGRILLPGSLFSGGFDVDPMRQGARGPSSTQRRRCRRKASPPVTDHSTLCSRRSLIGQKHTRRLARATTGGHGLWRGRGRRDSAPQREGKKGVICTDTLRACAAAGPEGQWRSST
jgi:hypothetical protein